MGEASLRTSLY